jgi:hypothetical protein
MRGLTDLYSDSFLNYRLLIQKVAFCSRIYLRVFVIDLTYPPPVVVSYMA